MKSDCLSRCLVTALASLVISSVALDAATLHVGQDATAEFRTIQDAVRAAVSGDEVVISPGVYRGPGNHDITLTDQAITIRSTDPLAAQVVETTVIDCAGTPDEPRQGFYVTDCNGVEISGLTITNGWATAGGAAFCKKSKLSLTHCRIRNNAALSAAADDGVPGRGQHRRRRRRV
jgi:pectin methylesterase-like acyl-CoA thioesterase